MAKLANRTGLAAEAGMELMKTVVVVVVVAVTVVARQPSGFIAF